VIPLKEQEYIKERFARDLEGKVKIDFFTQRASKIFVPGRQECATCEEAGTLINEVVSLSEKVLLNTHEFTDAREEAQKLGVDKVPAFVLRGPANRPLRFFGVPAGNEFPNFIETIVDLSKAKIELPAEIAKQLKKIKDDVSIDVYVTPTCPHCPGVVRSAYRLALASARIEASAIEIGEFPAVAQQLGVRAVPFTVINKAAAFAGAVDEAGLVEAIQQEVTGAPGSGPSESGPTTEAGPPPGSPPPGPPPGSGLILPR
jgi:glutaredoxin-like protein